MVYSIFKEVCLFAPLQTTSYSRYSKIRGTTISPGIWINGLNWYISCQISCLPLYCLGKLKGRGFCRCICQCRVINACLS